MATFLVLAASICLLAGGPVVLADEGVGRLPEPSSKKIDFKRDIYPILVRRCFRCHEGRDARAGYRLDLRPELLGETNGVKSVEIGRSAASKLIHLVVSDDPDKRMPPRGKKLDANEVALLRAWIDQGLVWDESLLPSTIAGSDHWAFQPPKRPPLPKVDNIAWVRNPIDRFIAARHEAEGLSPAPEASRRVWLQRVTWDLTGLPATVEEIEAFVRDTSADAYEKVVERLLASPHYGERWGRHWLDLARYADSEGYESDHIRPYAWRYRDYVIKSFNQDKPYDRFLREQIAGDEIEPYSDENLIATGFLASARISSNEEDKALQRNDILVDIVNATGAALLGLTIQCAQCHSHKFDPITNRDYYRFQGFFVKGAPNNLVLKDARLWSEYEGRKPADYDEAVKLRRSLFESARQSLIEKAKKKLTAEELAALAIPSEKRTMEQERLAQQAGLKFQFTPNQIERAISGENKKLYEKLKKRIAEVEKSLPDKPQTFGFYSPATSPHQVEVLPMKGFYPPPYEPERLARSRPYILIQGDVHRRGPAVDVGWPVVFGPTPKLAVEKRPRSALADWLADPKNPLTARVWANRIWQYHFGRGIVATSSDFGTRGAPPTHPELLDWLATELIRSGWSTKHMHRLIVLSSTYRQSSRPDGERTEKNTRIDAENRYLWRWHARRLEIEAIRDGILAVSGKLDRRIGGPPDPDENQSVRRTLYLLQRRQQAPEVQRLFDGPDDAAVSCPKRSVSTVPLQALYLLNNPFAVEQAKQIAERVKRRAGDDIDAQIRTAFRIVLGRKPDAGEVSAANRLLAEAGLASLCQALFNLNEFVYLE
ncbi:MAG: hypothetical protein KatS3mg105_2285 [Gemmatales bacterium]|nr:MAG: hypothetical protein KatS3mg105_2285 [Gemmatales bacterium]